MKAPEAHKMTEEEIKLELGRLRRQLFDLRSQSVTDKLEDPTQLGKAKKDIARLLTEQRSRQLKKAEVRP
jgi:large subunit ribosomal protein L29